MNYAPFIEIILKYTYYIIWPALKRYLFILKPTGPFRPQMVFGFLRMYTSVFMTRMVPFLPFLTLIIPILLKGMFLDVSEIGNPSVEIVNPSLTDTENTTSESELISKKKQSSLSLTNLKAAGLFTLVVLINLAIK